MPVLACLAEPRSGLALLLNRQMRGRNVYRALLILPWAIPVVASLQIWRTEYNFEFGAVNQLLDIIGLGPIPWMSDPFWNFVARWAYSTANHSLAPLRSASQSLATTTSSVALRSTRSTSE